VPDRIRVTFVCRHSGPPKKTLASHHEIKKFSCRHPVQAVLICSLELVLLNYDIVLLCCNFVVSARAGPHPSNRGLIGLRCRSGVGFLQSQFLFFYKVGPSLQQYTSSGGKSSSGNDEPRPLQKSVRAPRTLLIKNYLSACSLYL
jgi:hypothetical protein